MTNKSSLIRTRIWLFSNLSFIFLYSVYLLSWIIILPYVEQIPRMFFNTIGSLSYFSALDLTKMKLESLITNSNLCFGLFFATNPGLLFSFPFYILSIINTTRMLIRYKFRYKILQYIDSERQHLVFIAYLLQYMFVVPLAFGLLTDHSTVSSVVIYIYFLKISFDNDSVFKETLFYIIHHIDFLAQKLPNEQQRVYFYIKKSIQQHFNAKGLIVTKEE